MTLFKLKALQDTARFFLCISLCLICCIMSCSSNRPLASQQVPWPLPPQRAAALDYTGVAADVDNLIQSQATSIPKTLQHPIASSTSETSAIATSAVSDVIGEKPQWQAVRKGNKQKTKTSRQKRESKTSRKNE